MSGIPPVPAWLLKRFKGGWRYVFFLFLFFTTFLLIYFSYRIAEETRTLAIESATEVAEEVSVLIKQRSMAVAEELLDDYMEQKTLQIESRLESAIDVATTLSEVLAGMQSAGIAVDVGRDSVNEVLNTILSNHDEFFATYTVWEPNAFDMLDLAFVEAPGHDSSGRFIPYWYRNKQGDITQMSTPNYGSAWPDNFYWRVKQKQQSIIVGPWQRQVGEQSIWVISVVIPIMSQQRFLGAVGVDLKPQLFQDIAEETPIPLTPQGEMLLMSSDGLVVATHGRSFDIGFSIAKQSSLIDILDVNRGDNLPRQYVQGAFLMMVKPVILPPPFRKWVSFLKIPKERVELDGIAQHSKMMEDVRRVEKSLLSESKSGLWLQVLLALALLIYSIFMIRLLRILDQQQDELRKSENRLQSILDNTEAVIYIKDIQGRYLLINKRFEQLFNLEDKNVRGKTDFDLFSHEIAAAFQHNDHLALRKDISVSFEEVAPLKDGQHTYISLKFPIRDGHGKVYGICGISTDITKRKKAEEMVQDLNKELEARVSERTEELSASLQSLQQTQAMLVQKERLAALGDMVSGIAHEVNTPLGNAVTVTSFIEDSHKQLSANYANNAMTQHDFEEFLQQNRDSLEVLSHNLKRAAELIRTFKEVSVEQSHYNLREFAIKTYLDKVIKSLHPKLKKTAHQVHLECDETLVVHSYPGPISQILTNLVMNSLIHGFESMEQGRIEIVFTPQGNEICCIYRDNGCGMSAEVKERIFEPFMTTKRNQGGSGLGMHIIYKLVTEKLRGRIECLSEEGSGMEVIIFFPKQLNAFEDDIMGKNLPLQ